MMGDNDQATNLACEDILTQANRYFRLEYHFCKECFEAGDTSSGGGAAVHECTVYELEYYTRIKI